ncbi:MAG: EAL domain-containing protein [Candidatus Omnitrophica bacterium]|nr:EAL domain-containing protein [Candidatus Omnitrophota bacterium]
MPNGTKSSGAWALLSGMKKKNKILILIDEPRLRASLAKELEALHHTVVSRGDDNVLSEVFDEVPHLIVVDEDYKNKDGRNIALGIKEDLVLKYIPIILLVGREEPPGEGAGARIDFHFVKGKSAEEFRFYVREALTKSAHELDLNPLTRLPGTRSSVLRIDRAIHSKKLFAVCCIDLSDLSAFNSAYGDARGDAIIRRLGEIAQEVLKKEGGGEDFLGHLGGDDLIVLTQPEAAVPISQAVIERFDAAIPDFYDPQDRERGYLVQRDKAGHLAHYPIMNVRIAIVHNDTIPLTAMTEITRIAGELKRYMKTLPGSCYVKYRRTNPAPHKQPAENLSLEVHFPTKMKSVTIAQPRPETDKYSELFSAILRGKKIQTVYQPIVELSTRQIIGYEALTRGVTEPPLNDATLLFSVARESGRVKELDKLCVDYALLNGQSLPAEKKLFLNLNHETLIDSGLMKNLFSEKGGIGFKNLVIEVTEQSILRSFDKMRNALAELKAQGLSVAIDDVGGGAVSLRDVAILKPDYIKFDRTLIREIDTSPTKQQIVLSMILFANGIEAMTTAEGIETREEYETVLHCGIHLGQGYYFARPSGEFAKAVSHAHQK